MLCFLMRQARRRATSNRRFEHVCASNRVWPVPCGRPSSPRPNHKRQPSSHRAAACQQLCQPDTHLPTICTTCLCCVTAGRQALERPAPQSTKPLTLCIKSVLSALSACAHRAKSTCNGVACAWQSRCIASSARDSMAPSLVCSCTPSKGSYDTWLV
jgi:hypothetical protein